MPPNAPSIIGLDDALTVDPRGDGGRAERASKAGRGRNGDRRRRVSGLHAALRVSHSAGDGGSFLFGLNFVYVWLGTQILKSLFAGFLTMGSIGVGSYLLRNAPYTIERFLLD